MRVRDLFVSELTVSKRSRRYADPLPSYLMTLRENESLRAVNRVRSRPKSGRFLLRLPWRR